MSPLWPPTGLADGFGPGGALPCETDSPQGTLVGPRLRCTGGAAGFGGRSVTSRVEVSHSPITAQCIGSVARTATRSPGKVWSELLTHCNHALRPFDPGYLNCRSDLR